MVICAFITDNIDFLRATEEPAEACENNESAYYAQRHIRLTTVCLPVVGKVGTNHTKGDQHYQTYQDVDPSEDCIGETRYIQEIICLPMQET